MTTEFNETLRRLLADEGLGLFPREIKDEVERLLDGGQGLEPATRKRFVDAAARGVHHISVQRAPLEVLLFETRREIGRSAEDIAGAASIDVELIYDIERGDRMVESQSAATIIAWIQAVDVDAAVAVSALHRTLQTPAASAAYSGTARRPLSDEQKTLVVEVARGLGVEPPTDVLG